MKKFLVMLAVSSAFASQTFAQTATTAPSTAAKPSAATTVNPTTPAAAPMSMCKDGTPPVGKTNHACRGHGGMITNAPSSTMTAAAGSASGTTSKAAPAQATPMSGGGAGQVWVNTSSKVYHCEGNKYYGKTKKGAYMAEADAKTKGFHADHGKACTK